ncbi:MAG TPA: methyltransferase domain-containing protein [Ktedonobacterales bacterium]|nr:methyltransferase domain-containing protein [Ktedonobacterales bacterium]
MATQQPEEAPATAVDAPDTPDAPDMTDAMQLRRALVEGLCQGAVCLSPAVEHALLAVPRHLFVPGVPLQDAYADIAIPTHWEEGVPVSSASQPAIVALMLEQLRVEPGMRVLEVGAGTGYNAALLAELAGPHGRVVTLDIDAEIVAEARAHLDAAGYPGVRAIAADGATGWRAEAPYDRIMLTASASDLTPAWLDQLAEGGVLVLPLWLGGAEMSVALRKEGDTLRSESLTPCGFMRLRGAEAGDERRATLPGGRQLFAAGAPQLAGPIADLLATRPRRRFIVPPARVFLQYLGMLGHSVVSIYTNTDAASPRRVRGRHGIFVAGSDGRGSLALVAASRPMLLSFGGGAAEDLLAQAESRAREAALLPLEAWRVSTYQHAVAAALAPSAGVVRLVRRHFTFDVDMCAPSAPAAASS